MITVTDLRSESEATLTSTIDTQEAIARTHGYIRMQEHLDECIDANAHAVGLRQNACTQNECLQTRIRNQSVDVARHVRAHRVEYPHDPRVS